MPSLLWCCWLSIRKSIRPVKIELWSVGVVICLERGANCLRVVQLMPLHPKTPLSLAWFKSRLFLPFWYRFTQVVLEKRPLKGCSVVYYYMLIHFQEYMSTLLHCAKVLWQNVCWYSCMRTHCFVSNPLCYCEGSVKKLERQLQSASTPTQSSATTPDVSRSPAASRVNGLIESVHHRISSSPVKSPLPRSSDSSSKIVPNNGAFTNCI